MSSTDRPEVSWLRFAAQVLGTAGSYWVLGRLALELAIPPGITTAVWPAAGLALVAVLVHGWRIWPGIVLGSVLIDLTRAGALDSGVDANFWIRVVAIAVIVAGQAVVGAELIRRYVAYPGLVGTAREVLLFLALAGPVSCLIGSTAGVPVLVATGAFGWDAAPLNWGTWWLGDVLGSVLMAPLLLCFVGRPRRGWRTRVVTVALPVILAFVLAVIVYISSVGLARERMTSDFDRRADVVGAQFELRFAVYESVLGAAANLAVAESGFEPSELSRFARASLIDHPGIQALGWVARVAGSERAKFEAETAEDFGAFEITQRTPDGRDRADDAVEYFPLYFMEPAATNAPAIGIDIGSSPMRGVLEKARRDGTVESTEPQDLVPLGPSRPGVLVFRPIYEGGRTPVDLATRERTLLGYVVMGLGGVDVIEDSLDQIDSGDLDLQVTDLESGAPIYESRRLARGLEGGGWLVAERQLAIPGRTWTLRMWPSVEPTTRQPWAVLVSLLVAAGLLISFLLVASGRSARIEVEVAERTLALTESNAALASEMEQRGAAEEALRKSEALSRSIVETTVDAIVTFDGESRIKGLNKAAEAIFAVERDELVGTSLSRLVPAARRHLFGREDQSMIGRRGELEGERSSGEKFPIAVAFSKVELADRELYTAIIRDITAEKELELMKQELVSVILHELRTPLTSIRASLRMLDEGFGGPVTDDGLELVQLGRKGCDRLLSLVNDMLDLDKLAAGRELSIVDIRPLDLLERSAEVLRAMATAAGVELVVEGQSAATLAADDRLLQQVLTNLVGNAIKFSGADKTVRLVAEDRDGAVFFAVVDEGPGIPDEDQARIFDRFQQARSEGHRRYAGTGLGLAIAQEIVEAHEGQIGVESRVGEGSTFWFLLPVKGA